MFTWYFGWPSSTSHALIGGLVGAAVASAGVILGAALLGGPVSTTQVVSSSIMGAGSADRVSKVRWTVARDIAVAWLLTIPVAALVAAGIYAVVRLLFAGS